IKVTILANPVTTITTPPAAVCEQEVDLASTWSVTNVTDKLITEYLDGTTELASSKVTESGTYTITNKYVNDYSNIGAISVTPQTTPGYCVGNPVDVTVTIDTLSTPLISGSLTACPGIQEELKVSAISNVASISYSWDGAITATGDKIMGGTTNSTKGQTFTYTVTATAGTCSETSAPHTITVGDGPVEGLMTATETDNSLSQFMFTDDNGGQERVVYACGNELTLNVNYNNTNSVAGTEFTWYDGATSIGTGASIQIPETTSPATKTYEVKYFNKCAASAKVTVHFVPLGIDPTLAEKPLTLCEGNPFNLKFEHNSSAILQPQIKWFKNGTEIANETKNQYTIASTTSADNGKYGFEISFKGCKETVTLTDLTVIPAISATTPATPTICEGEEVELEITNVKPQGTTISWEADATIISGEQTSKVTVKPTYKGGSTHQAEYTYKAIAYNSICDSKKEYPVSVLVDEALSGSISGRNAICENESTTLNATAYDASTYTWKEGATVLAQSGVVTVKPLVTTTYEIEMTRGKCSATDNYMVEVTTNPVIVSVDSVGVRDRQVITEAGKGTAPFEFWYDENTANVSVDDIFYGLTFTTHVAHVKDINGCQASYKFILDPPAINVPEFFSPNGDGVNDKWVVGSLAEVYPDALVVIYDRFGKELIQFKGGDIDGWDGTYNGVPMPSTDYWYVIDIEEIDMQYSGHFTLLRQ
ncbi:MAG: T9SS type B sorting domain-containing protein, partial [Paludibacteraceae bacterium]|nr:T9SS type B sorting domain-containing protein [Paludibacteraceae bacterium]